ncbi:MAG: amidase family protein [Paracoccus sp. (in: a-proteobacteria)]|uniref:amidase n=1 Tax=Paracoccus sp. TaxID=267 RepID=UPI0026E06B1E|nr:amidase family protein [Paracoccus sp. (in: a-proteobacteria)]MDO5622943.1 amidase family protein [Paracoccus sp. (in: a-proteobacteria)]
MTTPLPSLSQIATELRQGALSSHDLVARAIATHDATEARLNAYKTWAGDRALAQAETADRLLADQVDLGPLMGIPVSVKDLYGVPGLPVFAGTDSELPSAWQRPGPVIARLLSQLGIVMGKTHTVEFAFGGLGVNAHWGTPVNPCSAPDAPRAPGGSSSGAGVSLAQGSALIAFGTDTAGSVRVPASLTGQVALKTTWGRWSLDGIVPLSPSLDTPGLLCRTVADLAYAFAALEGQPVPSPRPVAGLRIGVPEHLFWDQADAAIIDTTRAALDRLAQAGAKLVPVTLPGCDAVLEVFAKGGLAAPELRAFLNQRFPERIARLDPVVRMRVEGAENLSATEYLRRRTILADAARAALGAFADCDVIATPTVAISPPLLSELADPAAYGPKNMLTLRNTAVVNLLGLCALTLPSGRDHNDMPVGLQLIAPPMAEPLLLSVGQGVETTLNT